jgi:ABC-type phosphate/phosphonate transport system substrate-binding protein
MTIKTIKLFVVTTIALFAGAYAALPTHAATPKTYIFGARLTASNEGSAHFKGILTAMIAAFNETNEDKISLKWYALDAEFLKAAAKSEPDIVLLNNYDVLYTVAEKYGYSVFMTSSVLGADVLKTCLYVKKDSPLKTIKDLHGATAATYDTAFEYYQLREMTGEKPEAFFSRLDPSPNGLSSIYSLAMGNTNAAFSYDANFGLLKIINPGPTKLIRILACSEKFTSLPFLYSKKTPPEFTKKILDFMKVALKSERLKQFRPMDSTFKTRFVPASNADYKSVFDIFQKAEAAGWEKDFKKWIAYSESEN